MKIGIIKEFDTAFGHGLLNSIKMGKEHVNGVIFDTHVWLTYAMAPPEQDTE
jgi:hypothetical protein